MALCWKYMVPLSFICLVGTTVWMLIFGPKSSEIFSMVMFIVALAILGYFFKRVVFQIRKAQPELYFKPHI